MKRYEFDQFDRLYATVWGDSIHFGFYADRWTGFDAAVLAAKRAMARAASLTSGDLVLEVASGWGAAARFLADEIGCTVVATNYAHRQAGIAAARCAAQIAAGTIRPAMADYHALPFRDALFDAHWSQESLVHARDKARVFAEAYRVLKPGGVMVFTDQMTLRHRLTQAEAGRIAARHGSGDLWSAADFEAGLSAAGFEIVVHEDWTGHMARHFRALHGRLVSHRGALSRDVDSTLLDENADMWRWGAELAEAGKIGYAMIAARKPGA
ncbi:MAG: methyltransferase domain-containing protein [Alphaproteobacteria bacterium]|nr:methyltransferase domain-containing protein [Alphaproteobacteria bacterium]